MTSSVMKPIVEDTYSLGDNNYNSTSTNRKHRSFSLSLSALSRSRSKDDTVKKPGDSIDSVDLITSSKLFSQSQPSLPINNTKNAKKSKVIKKRISNSALSTSSASSSSSSSSSSSIFHRWSSFGRKSKQSKESEQWWQEFEREVDPSLLKTADSSLAVSSKSKDGCKPLAKSNYSSPSVRPSVLSDSPQHIFRRQHDKNHSVENNASVKSNTKIIATAPITVARKPMALATGQKVVSKLHNPGHGDLFPEYNRQRNSKFSWFDIDPETQRLADLSPDTRDYVLYQRMQQPDMSACISKLPSRPTRIQHRRPTLNQSTNYHPIEFFNSSTSFAMWPDKESATTVSAMNGGRLRRRRKGLGIYPYGVHILTALEEVTEPESSDTEADSFISDAQSVITMNTTATISTTQIENSALLAMDWRVVVQGSRDSGFGETLELSDSKTDACLPNSDSNDSYNTKQSPIATITPTINATFINTNIITIPAIL